MIRGKVAQTSEPIVEIAVAGPAGHSILLNAMVDTGFNGYLMLPTDIVVALSLEVAGERSAILGDGSIATINSYFAFVEWHGRTEEVHVLEGSGDPLIGMSLLGGSRLTIDAVPDGEVTIDELP